MHRMLYDFHRDLNLRKPNSCHATYILSGLRSISSSDAGGKGDDGNGSGNGGADTGVDKDVYMHSSPFELSSQPTPMEGVEAGFGDARKGAGMVRSIVLVPEERLDGRCFLWEEGEEEEGFLFFSWANLCAWVTAEGNRDQGFVSGAIVDTCILH